VTRRSLVHDVLGRSDYAMIGDTVTPGSTVLDLGCGEGELLAWLAENKNVKARGVELSKDKVRQAIARGVSAYQADLQEALDGYPDQSFDFVILSQTLQEARDPMAVLRGMLRVGRRGIVAFPNFGHWSVRLSLLHSGRAPKTQLFPYDWYNSPNIHVLTVFDFELLVAREHWKVERRIFLSGHREVSMLPNLTAEIAVFVLSR
jgi:methionine biosynthesis protein MetW